jgi:hypothetical protein
MCNLDGSYGGGVIPGTIVKIFAYCMIRTLGQCILCIDVMNLILNHLIAVTISLLLPIRLRFPIGQMRRRCPMCVQETRSAH